MGSKNTNAKITKLLVGYSTVCLILQLLLIMQFSMTENTTGLVRTLIMILYIVIILALSVFKLTFLSVFEVAAVLLLTAQNIFLTVSKSTAHSNIFLGITILLFIYNFTYLLFIKTREKKKRFKGSASIRSLYLGIVLGCIISAIYCTLTMNLNYPFLEIAVVFILFINSLFLPHRQIVI